MSDTALPLVVGVAGAAAVWVLLSWRDKWWRDYHSRKSNKGKDEYLYGYDRVGPPTDVNIGETMRELADKGYEILSLSVTQTHAHFLIRRDRDKPL